MNKLLGAHGLIGEMKTDRNHTESQREQRVELGQYIVADPAICHGRVTFKGTRIFVADVLADVESGLSWDFILTRWGGGKISKAAIAEALQLSRHAWLGKDGRLLPQASPLPLPKAA